MLARMPQIADKSARTPDLNGWWEVRDNPITKVGVFDYHGSQLPGCPDPDRVYRVYRPEEELSDPEFLASLRLLPLVDDHTVLGSEDRGGTPAEAKGVHGTIGEAIRFDSPYVRGNLKVWSEAMARKIDPPAGSGVRKKELSLGYGCALDWTPGTFGGVNYDVVQRRLRANHLALVKEGRMGPDVAVLDQSLTFFADSLEYVMPDENKTPGAEPTIAELVKMIEGHISSVAPLLALMPKLQALATPNESGEMDEAAKKLAADAEAAKAAGGGEEQAKVMAEQVDKINAMDATIKAQAKQIADLSAQQQDSASIVKAVAADAALKSALVPRLVPLIGAFAADAMSHADVVAYGVAQLKLKPAAGTESVVLDAYLEGLTRASAPRAAIADSAAGGTDIIADFLNPKKDA